MRQFIFVLSLCVLLPCLSSAQPRGRRFQKHTELAIGGGLANYLGELGGGNSIGKQNSPVDMRIRCTRMAYQAGLRRSISRNSSWKANLGYTTLCGEDRLTQEQFRRNRNLSFKTPLVEASLQFETGYHHKQSGERYLRRVQGVKNTDQYYYVFAGLGLIHFNPKAQYQGTWYNLQPLGTEGQGLNGKKPYSRVAVTVPVGAGLRWKINRWHSLNFELGYRFAFTDYLDDVSTTYYNNSDIRAGRGAAAAYFADPSTKKIPDATLDGEKRGNPEHNDGYLVLSVQYVIRLQKRDRWY